jgi:hypothetical protein
VNRDLLLLVRLTVRAFLYGATRQPGEETASMISESRCEQSGAFGYRGCFNPGTEAELARMLVTCTLAVFVLMNNARRSPRSVCPRRSAAAPPVPDRSTRTRAAPRRTSLRNRAHDRLLPRRIRPHRVGWSALLGERLAEAIQVCTGVLRSEPKRLGEQGLGDHQRTRIGAVPQVLEPLR